MRVAFVNQPWSRVTLPVHHESIKLWTYQMTRHLARDIEVIAYARRGRGQPAVEWHEGVQYRRLYALTEAVLLDRLGRLFPRGDKRPSYASPLAYAMYHLRVSWDLRRQACRLVHVHNLSQAAPLIRRFNPRITIALHMHCEWLTQLDRSIIEPRLRAVDLVLCCSDFIAGRFRSAFPEFAERCHTVWNFVDVQRFLPAEGEPKGAARLLHVARVSPEKGLHVLLDAFERVIRTHPETRLQVVGPGVAAPMNFIVGPADDELSVKLKPMFHPGYGSELRARLSREAAANVEFAGTIAHTKLPECYRDADIFLYPSVWHEPFGIPVVEAMAAGLPVVAAKSGGIPEILQHGKQGLLVERGDAGQLAEAIARLIENPGLRKSMGEAGRLRALELFTLERAADRLIQCYGHAPKDKRAQLPQRVL